MNNHGQENPGTPTPRADHRTLFDLLAEKDYEKVTVKDIARHANVHYGVIHSYFKGQE
ncbi:MAG: helix-turn-helix transcriptional regulator [Candidatus Hydrogenedentota bacterium]|nr:MAG: helix-turn-helix transcriptional regulator [Candidatus Hydrogenedentota bacterium]